MKAKGFEILVIVAALGAALALGSGVTGCVKGQEKAELTKTVIRVGDRVVTQEDYRAALKRFAPEVSDGDNDTGEVSVQELFALKKELVNQLIEEELILTEAERLGLAVSDAEFLSEINETRNDYMNGSFKGMIRKNYGNLEAWKKAIRRKLLIKKTIEKEISTRVKVTDEEARAYYKENIEEFDMPEMVHARMIVVASEEKAAKMRTTLTPEGFATIAREVSLGPEAAEGGDLGFFAKGEMPKEFEDVVFNLEPGIISNVIKTDYGYHIFLVEEKKESGRIPFEEVKDTISEGLFRERAEVALTDWIASLRKKTRVVIREELL